MPKYDLAGNPLPETGASAPLSGPGGVPPQAPPAYGTPPPSMPGSDAPVRYDLAGNPMPASATPPTPSGGQMPGVTPGRAPQPGAWPPPPTGGPQATNPYGMPQERNTSGSQGSVPPEIARLHWNWGASGVPVFWCWYHGLRWVTVTILVFNFLITPLVRVSPIGQQEVMAFLTPVVSLALTFYLGFTGNKIAWRNRQFYGGVPEFFQVQRGWMVWGMLVFCLNLLAISAALVFPLMLKARMQARVTNGGYTQPYGNGAPDGSAGSGPGGQ